MARSKKWSSKEERQYERIKESAADRGTATERAKEIAARTVNKQRRERGKTANRRTMGTGNPRAPLAQRSRDELYNRARQLDIPGRSSMNKQELVRALQNRR